jgi:glycolate oxidase FAD binding subunit
MILRPNNKQDLALGLAAASREGRPVDGADLSALNKVLWHTPEDMTVKVETGITLSELQSVLGRRGQWLPIDPPQPESLTIAALLASNVTGPRRFGFGTIRDHLIGLQVALADGKLASSGGNVVKNVAGYDLMKLFIGAQHSLGFPVEATFKLLPRPEAETFVQSPVAPLGEVDRWTQALLESELMPTVLDWRGELNEDPAALSTRLVIGFAGTSEEVRWQTARAADLGIADPATLEDENAFWKTHGASSHSLSVLPSHLAGILGQLGSGPFVARAGNGVVHYVGQPHPRALPAASLGLTTLAKRIKDIFDPGHILPELSP